MPAASGDFVRAAEWRRVREFAAAAANRSRPAALVIAGEPGAGKSSLWRAAVATAAEAGCRVLRSEPSASEADTPFAGLSDLLAGALPAAAAGIPARQREALEVALLMRPAGDQPPAAHAIDHGVTEALCALAGEAPVLLAIDDAQWLDAGSRATLEYALRRVVDGPRRGSRALSLLLAARTDAQADPLTVGAPPVSHGWRGLLGGFPVIAEITLAPLTTAQVQELLPAAAPGQARLVTERSRGNPFWAREIWASMMSARAAGAGVAADDAPLPPLARTALAGRLERSLAQPVAEALAVVAAAGRISVSDAVAAMRGDHVADPAAALERALRAGVVVQAEDRLVPAHPLIGAAAVDAVPPGRRARIYRQLAAVSASPERRAQFAALAAGPEADPGVAAVLDAAAEAAHARAANAAAGKFAAQAVTFTPQGDRDALVRRRIKAGELLYLAGDLTSALQHLEALDVDALPTADLERAMPLLADAVGLVRGPGATTALLTGALAVAGDDDRKRAGLLSLISDALYGVPGQRRAAAVEAIQCAEAAGTVAGHSLHRALLNLVVEKVTAGEGLDTRLLARAEGLEATLPGLPLLETAGHCRGIWCRYTDDLETSRAAHARLVARARETDDDLALSLFLPYLALTAELAGDYAAAAAALAETDQVTAWYDRPESPWTLEPRCKLLIVAGQLTEARRLADEQLPDVGDQPLMTRFMGASLRGEISAWAGDTAATIRHLEQAARYADELNWTEPGVRSRIDHLLAEAYVAADRRPEARRISAWLLGLGRRMDRPALIGDACRIEALAAAASGDLAAAAECARSAVDQHERTALRPELAASLLVLSRVERRRKARAHSRAALDRARDLAAAMGHQPLLTQIESEFPRVAAIRTATALTDAERRVAEKIAAGATNREAAAELFISVRTVETHVAAIYRKLDIRHRSELRRILSPE
ncbi:MAG TPA: AAA family ATPase [Trebonia sp.]|nr:AAA family ATPase [Trebonia sp.]